MTKRIANENLNTIRSALCLIQLTQTRLIRRRHFAFITNRRVLNPTRSL